jgi:hypothetical protein
LLRGALGCRMQQPMPGAGFGGAVGPLEKNPRALTRWHGVPDYMD